MVANAEDSYKKKWSDGDGDGGGDGDGEVCETTTRAEDSEELSWRCWLCTLFAATPAMLVFVFTGATEGQSAVMLPQLKEQASRIHITPDQETWIASLGVLLTPVSATLIGPAIDAFGRKKGLQFFYLSMGLGFGVIASAKEVFHIYIGRCICALAIGLEVIPVVYLAEISTARQRSYLFALVSATYAAGVTLTYVVGVLPWETASGIFGLGCMAMFIMQCFTPESPSWLYKTSQLHATTESLRRLGRSPSLVLKELQLLKLTSQNKTEDVHLKDLLHPTVWRPFVILVVFHVIQTGSGIFDILYYTVDFVGCLGTRFDPVSVSIAASVARLTANASLGIYFTSSVSRKLATAFSAFSMAVAFAGMAVYEYVYRDTSVELRPFQWVPVTLFAVSLMTCAMGMTSLPWLMAGEMFPLRVRGAMTSACFVVGAVFMFVTLKIYYWCLEAVQIWGLLFVFAGVAFLGVPFGMFLLPETQNKTLWEVEQGFLPQKKRTISVEMSTLEIATVS